MWSISHGLSLLLWFTAIGRSLSHCGLEPHALCLKKCCPNHQAIHRGRCVDFEIEEFTMDVYDKEHLKKENADPAAMPFVTVTINLTSSDRGLKNKTKEDRHKRQKEEHTSSELHIVENLDGIQVFMTRRKRSGEEKETDKYVDDEEVGEIANNTISEDDVDLRRNMKESDTDKKFKRGTKFTAKTTTIPDNATFPDTFADKNRMSDSIQETLNNIQNNGLAESHFDNSTQTTATAPNGIKFGLTEHTIEKRQQKLDEVPELSTLQPPNQPDNGEVPKEDEKDILEGLQPPKLSTSLQPPDNNEKVLKEDGKGTPEDTEKAVDLTEVITFFDDFLANKTIKITPERVDQIRTVLIQNKNALNLNDEERASLLEFLTIVSAKDRAINYTGPIGGRKSYFIINLEFSRSLIENLKFRNVLTKIQRDGLVRHRTVGSGRDLHVRFQANTTIDNRNDTNKSLQESPDSINETVNFRPTSNGTNAVSRQSNRGSLPKHVHNIHVRDKPNSTVPSIYNAQVPPKLYLIHGRKECKKLFRLAPHLTENTTYYVLDNGSLFFPFVEKSFATPDYCLDYFVEDDQINPLVCFLEPVEQKMDVLYAIGMSISMGFLIITFIVYAMISELRNLHGCCLMCHIFSMFMAYGFLVVTQVVVTHYEEYVPAKYCVVIGFLIQFFFLATFFWLNVMCFDIWWTFSSTVRPIHGTISHQENTKFLFYSLYAWLCPVTLVGITIAMDLLPEISWIIKPGFGEKRCWFTSDLGMLIYFYGPVGCLVIANIVMFLSTARTLLAHHKVNATILKTGGSKKHVQTENERFRLYLKLFAVMGVNWIMEVVSWACGGEQYFWYVSDLTNALQGVFIFLIFVCKRRILTLLVLKVYPKCRWQYFTDSKTSGGSSGTTARSVLSLQSIQTRVKGVMEGDDEGDCETEQTTQKTVE
ncbi:hypothetical protein M8J76_007285 [Diaphorina citri]|nr:hypothetical protein M8J76_007285 [Diaphorina citri]KAI5719989.1 hypothetical protein M8J77_000254 [Diaphorina citri]